MTLHNQALALAGSDPAECMRLLAKLLDEGSFPETTVANLLILYCKSVGHTAVVHKLDQSIHCLDRLYGAFECLKEGSSLHTSVRV